MASITSESVTPTQATTTSESAAATPATLTMTCPLGTTIIKDAVESFGAYKEERVPREAFEAALDTYLTSMCGDGRPDPPLWKRALCNGGAPRAPGATLVQGLHMLSEGKGKKMRNGALVGLYIVKGVLTTTGSHGGARTDVYYLMGRRQIGTQYEGCLAIKLFK